MATLASALVHTDREFASPRALPSLVVAQEVIAAPPTVYERSVYQPSRRAAPVAFLASAGVILAAMAALATLNVVAQHRKAEHLTVVSMKELDTTPPPPPPERLEKPVVQPPQAFVPKPRIALPSPGPTQVALDTPPPPAPPVAVAAQVVAPAGPAVAAPPARSAEPVEGGDLSSQVLSARPPVYPVDARRRKQQGTVKLMVLVGPDGKVADIQLAGSSGSDLLDRAALSAVKRWRWTPQKQNGAPVSVRGFVTIPFVLTA